MRNMTFVKICGLRSAEDALAASQAHPDCAGMILSEGFRRSVSIPAAREISAALSKDIPLCGVFVNEKAEDIVPFVKEGLIDRIQLHGQEPAELVDELHAWLPGVQVIKAMEIHSLNDVIEAEAYPADLLLLDGGKGEGKEFDWDYLKDFRRPYILAGGLTAENVQKAILLLHPFGVDASSGVETEGKKDAEKMKAFVKAVRDMEESA